MFRGKFRRGGRGKIKKNTDGMNKLEAAYAAELDERIRRGEVLGYRFEAIKFILAPKTTYTVDFLVQLADGTVECHETKGFWEEDARVKIKVAAAAFSLFTFRAITRKGGQWKIETFD